MRSTLSDSRSLPPGEETPDGPWIHVPRVDRQALEDVGRRAGLPLELVTYCLLNQRRPKVVPCAAWLYCAWQVPVCRPGQGPDGVEVSFRIEEITACLGPNAIVTAHGSNRRTGAFLATLLLDGAELARERPSNLLVTLAERVSDAYVSAHEHLVMEDEELPGRRSNRHRQARRGTGVRVLRRYLRAHRGAIEQLILRSRRWLDSRQIARLTLLASRLAAIDWHAGAETGQG